MFSVSVTKSLGTQNEKKKKKIYLALAHSLRGLKERLKYRLSSGEGSKMLDFQMVATIRE